MLSLSLTRRQLLGLCAAALLAAPAAAQEAALALEIEVIRASTDGSGVAASLRPHAAQLLRQFPQFSGFVRTGAHSVSLDSGDSFGVTGPGDTSVRITYQGPSADGRVLQIQLPGGHTNVTVPPRGVFFVGGPRIPGGTLILAIRTT